MSLGLTFFLAIVLGAATGLLITFEKIFESVPDDQMFDDELFWHMAEDDSAGFHQHQETSKRGSVSRRRSRGRSSSKDLSNDSAIRSMAVSQESGAGTGVMPYFQEKLHGEGHSLQVPKEGPHYLP